MSSSANIRDTALPRRSPRRAARGLWPLDVALLLLSLLIMIMVLRLLRFDDPRILYNAWTYFLGVPTIVIATSMGVRTFVSNTIERSIQVGFLLSALIHLAFVFFAVNVVLLTNSWPELRKQMEEATQLSSSSRASTQFFQPVGKAGASRPDYLKPVETSPTDAADTLDLVQAAEESAKLEAVIPPESTDPKIADLPFKLERQKASASQPAITSQSQQLDRPDITKPLDTAASSIEIPNVAPAKSLAVNQPSAAMLETERTIRDSESANSLSAAPRLDLRNSPERDVEVIRPDVANRLRAANVRESEQSAALEQSVVSNANQPTIPRPMDQLRPSDRSDLDRPTVSQVPVPQLNSQREKTPAASEIGSRSELDSRSRTNVGGKGNATSINMLSGDISIGNTNSASIPSAVAAAAMRGAKGANGKDSAGASFLDDPRFAVANAPAGGRQSSSAGGAPVSNKPIQIESQIGGTGGVSGADGRGMALTQSDDVRSLGASRIDLDQRSSIGRGGADIGRSGLKAPGSVGPDPNANGRDTWTASFAGTPAKGLDTARVNVELPDIRASDITTDRFRRPEVGGPPIPKSAVPIPAPAFKQRMSRNQGDRGDGAANLGPLGPLTEETIERGLQFLAKYQREDGSWHLEDFDEPVVIRSNTAATGLALLSFQGAGYTHQQFKYANVCTKALDWMRSVQKPDGDLYQRMDELSDSNAWLYSHAIATLALCEAYGMTQDEQIKDSAQRAVDFLVRSQDPNGGGWRYTPRIGSDTSVTGWCMMALKSAELAGLQVPKSVYQGISTWLVGSQASMQQKYLYRYNWQAPDTPTTRHGRVPTPVMTSVGLLMRLYLGWKRDNQDMVRGSDWLLERPPTEGTVEVPLKDTYYWYYASQVLFHMGGERWKAWYGHLYPILIRSQKLDGQFAGSWEPNGEIPDAWGKYAGRLYVTTLNLLSLEVYYRHLPIYEATAE